MAQTRTRFVAEVTVAVDSSGTLQTFYFGTSGFSTTPGDTPANTLVSARLANPGTLQRELFSGARVYGAVRPSFGELVLHNADGGLDAWTGYGTGSGRVVVRWGPEDAAYPGGYTTVYVARIFSLYADFTELRLVLRDRSYLLDRPVVTSTFSGTGGAEGTSVAGRRKQLVIGNPGYIPPITVDPANGMHFVQANAAPAAWMNGIGAARYALFDAGIPVQKVTRTGTYALLLVEQPPTTGYALFGEVAGGDSLGDACGPVFVKYGQSAPTGELRMVCDGRLKNSAGDTLRHWSFSDLCQRAGLADVEPGTLAAGSVDFGIGNRLIENEETYLDTLNDCARAEILAYGFTRLDVPFAWRLKDPADTSDAADVVKYRFTKHNSSRFSRRPIPGMENPVWQVLVNTGRTWPCAVNEAALPTVRAELERHWPYTAFSATAETVRTEFPGAETTQVNILGRYFTTRAQQQTWGDRYLQLFGGVRDHFTLTCHDFSATTLALELHDKVELELARFGCSPARTFRIVSIRLNLQARTIDFGLWGGEPGPTGSEEVEIATAGEPPGGGGGSVPGGSPTIPTSTTERDRTIIIPPFRLFGRLALEDRGAHMRKIFGEFSLRPRDAVIADPLFSDVAVLVQGGGSGSDIVDQSPYAHSVTAVGNAQISTTIGSFANARSLKLDGTGDYATVPDHASFTISGALCVEVRFYLTDWQGGALQTVLSKMANVSLASHEFAVSITQTYIHFYYGTRGQDQFQLRLFWPASASLNTLHEGVIQCDDAGDWACWLDGDKGTDYQVSPLAAAESFGAVTTGTYNNSLTLGDTSHDLWIGAHFAGGELEGYVHVRMTHAERYSGDYTATPGSRWPTS